MRSISQKYLEELYTLRSALEKFAFSLAWPNRDEAALSDLDARYQRLISAQKIGDQARTIEHEIAFHSWVYEIANHDLLHRQWMRLAALVQIYKALHYNLHGSHGGFGAMSKLYKELASGDSLADIQFHIDDHMMQGLSTVLRVMA